MNTVSLQTRLLLIKLNQNRNTTRVFVEKLNFNSATLISGSAWP